MFRLSRITVTAMCNMDFSHFPLDSQTCSLELESCKYQYSSFPFQFLCLFSNHETEYCLPVLRPVYFEAGVGFPCCFALHQKQRVKLPYFLFPQDAYTDEDLMLYWKNGDESLKTDEKISLSQFLIQKFHTTSRLAFYSSTGS